MYFKTEVSKKKTVSSFFKVLINLYNTRHPVKIPILAHHLFC